VHIEAIRIRNSRRLKDVRIDFASDISIFVGANNGGKTSSASGIAAPWTRGRTAPHVARFSCGTARVRMQVVDSFE